MKGLLRFIMRWVFGEATVSRGPFTVTVDPTAGARKAWTVRAYPLLAHGFSASDGYHWFLDYDDGYEPECLAHGVEDDVTLALEHSAKAMAKVLARWPEKAK